MLLGGLPLLAVLKDDGGEVQRKGQAERMRQLPGQRQRLMRPLQGIVWIAERPQGSGQRGQAHHAGILAVEDGTRLGLTRIAQRDSLLQVRPSLDEVSEEVERGPQRLMRHQEELGVPDTLRQREKLGPDLGRRVELRPLPVEHVQSHQDTEQLRRLFDLLAQRPRARVGAFHLGRRITLRGHQRRAERGLERQLLLDAAGRIGQALEKLQRRGQVADRLDMGRARRGLVARLLRDS